MSCILLWLVLFYGIFFLLNNAVQTCYLVSPICVLLNVLQFRSKYCCGFLFVCVLLHVFRSIALFCFLLLIFGFDNSHTSTIDNHLKSKQRLASIQFMFDDILD